MLSSRALSGLLAALLLICGGCVRYIGSQKATGEAGAQADGGVDVAAPDGARLDTSAPDDLSGAELDAAAPDQLAPDATPPDFGPPPDAGCPTGKTWCGGACVDLKTSALHCGQCNKACSGDSDRCVNSTCVCGSASTKACDSGLNCKMGLCDCVKGGLCTGCCSPQGTCVFFAKQTAGACGVGGDLCASCEDGKTCTTDACVAGSCQNPPKANGTPCEDNLACTPSTSCYQGSCKGAVQSGTCLIDAACWSDGATKTSAKCRVCDASKDQWSWAYLANSGCVTTYAGSGVKGLKDGPLTTARFLEPTGLAIDGAGAIYVADSGNHVIRKIAAGAVATLAGTGAAGFVDGAAASAQFNRPTGVAVDSSGNVYVADSSNNRVRVISASTQTVTTLAGSGTQGSADGAAATAQFNSPHSVLLAAPNIYVADRDNHRIRAISGGTVSTVAGSNFGLVNGPVASAKFAGPYELVLTGGVIYVADKLNSLIRTINLGTVATYAGSTQGYQDGALATAKFKYIYGLGLTAKGELLVADGGNERIRVVSGSAVSTLAGDGQWGHVNGPAAEARFNSPHDAEEDAAGKIYIADYYNHCIRLYTP